MAARAQFGLALGGAGPINRAMGGASTAAPVDSAGALFWNPATISGLSHSEMEFGAELIIPRTTLSSRIPAGVLGPTAIAGTSGGNNGVFPLPTFGLVYRPDDSAVTYGLGFFTLGGFGVNYSASKTNPVLSPQFPFGHGAGALYSQYLAYQLAPSASIQLTDELSIGGSLNFDMGTLSVNPALFATPSIVTNSAGTGAIYPSATDGRVRFGGGFHLGAYYDTGGAWRFGAALKSPQWFETYRFNSVSGNGNPTTPKFNLDFPMIASVGTSYVGIEKLLLAADFRFVNYRDTNGFRNAGYNAQGALIGVGWQNVFVLALGAQYELSDSLKVRAGYDFCLDPISNAVMAFNVASPTILQHSLSTGFTYAMSKSLSMSLAYVHCFQNTNTGPIIQPFTGAIPGSSVRESATADSVIMGASVLF